MKKIAFASSVLCAFAFTLLVPRVAAAQQACNALTRLDGNGAAPAAIYITGSSALKPLIAALGPIVFADTVKPFTIVYLSQGSCKGVDAIINGTKLPATTLGPPVTNIASYWDSGSTHTSGQNVPVNGTNVKVSTDKEELCTLPSAPQQAVDIGASDVFAQSCGYALTGFPTGTADFQGPVQSMTFAVRKESKESSISANAAYFTFGLNKLDPWVDPNFIFRRNNSSGTQVMIATAIGADASKWVGIDKGSSDGVFNSLTALTTQTDIDKAIGILSSDFSARPELKQLAYQHTGQKCGFRPDIQPLDKRNTREGRYAIWGPLHLMTQIDTSTNLAQNPHARDLIAYLTGTQAPPLGVNLIRTDVQAHVVPPCAMKVQRKAEMGPMASFKPPLSCNCAWEKEALGTTSCKACTNATDCGSNQGCNFGFCEAQ